MRKVLFGDKTSISGRMRGFVVWGLNIMHSVVCPHGPVACKISKNGTVCEFMVINASGVVV